MLFISVRNSKVLKSYFFSEGIQMSLFDDNKDKIQDIQAALNKRGRCIVKTDEDNFLFWAVQKSPDSPKLLYVNSLKNSTAINKNPARSLRVVVMTLSMLGIRIEGVR